ncbi:MAG: twin-arginine translocase TatA/TatE family subunit [Candidatus Nezhaarchaeales archaeon]
MIGAAELLILFFIALLLFGPKKIPEIARTLGEAVREFRRASTPTPPAVGRVRDEELLFRVAKELGIQVEGKDVNEVAKAIIEAAKQRGREELNR